MTDQSYIAPEPPPAATLRQALRNGLGIAALILGTLGTLAGPSRSCSGPPCILGAIGLILVFVGRARAKRGEATNGRTALVGIITSAIAFVLSIVGVVIVVDAFGEAADEIGQIVEEPTATVDPSEPVESEPAVEPPPVEEPAEDTAAAGVVGDTITVSEDGTDVGEVLVEEVTTRETPSDSQFGIHRPRQVLDRDHCRHGHRHADLRHQPVRLLPAGPGRQPVGRLRRQRRLRGHRHRPAGDDPQRRRDRTRNDRVRRAGGGRRARLCARAAVVGKLDTDLKRPATPSGALVRTDHVRHDVTAVRLLVRDGWPASGHSTPAVTRPAPTGPRNPVGPDHRPGRGVEISTGAGSVSAAGHVGGVEGTPTRSRYLGSDMRT